MIASTQTNHPLAGNGKAGARTPSPVEQAASRLKAAGLRITQPRLAILTALAQHDQPTSIERIHGEVGSAACDLVTVYRCMAAFEKIGIVERAFFHNGTALFRINLGKPARYHVVCKNTNRVADLDPQVASELRRAIEAVQEDLLSRGYTEVSHLVEFFATLPTPSRSEAAGQPPRS
ncbi:MAG: transcriptional repressor [Verrucomicrobia bacterium]|nr:transcriptional repressor [Verrucomicrobiota bacterium]